jgi:hypothetical protein
MRIAPVGPEQQHRSLVKHKPDERLYPSLSGFSLQGGFQRNMVGNFGKESNPGRHSKTQARWVKRRSPAKARVSLAFQPSGAVGSRALSQPGAQLALGREAGRDFGGRTAGAAVPTWAMIGDSPTANS